MKQKKTQTNIMKLTLPSIAIMTIYITVILYSDRSLKIDIKDKGCGIEDVDMARTPLFTTDTSGERSGMGFSVMESFMGGVSIYSQKGKGTRVSMTKQLKARV